MMIELLRHVPVAQLVVIHASLGRIEWHGALELAQRQAADAGVEFVVARANWADGSPKDFLNMAERRNETRPETPSFPSSKHRQCTSDLKRGPITRETLRVMKERGLRLVVNCVGIRGGESRDRSKLEPFVHLNAALDKQGKVKHALAKAGREAYEWLPIFDLTTFDVWCQIRGAGQRPHAAYYGGNERLSCVFCIMGKAGDLLRGALARPELFAEYVAMEERTGSNMHQSNVPLKDIVAKAALKAGIDFDLAAAA